MTLSTSAFSQAPVVDGYHEFNYGKDPKGAENWVQAIRVTAPELRSKISGDVMVEFTAAKMIRATAFCWQQPETNTEEPWGKDVNLTPGGIELDGEGKGSFIFPADAFPNGPVNIRIFAGNEAGLKDIFELQLFNTGGTVWNQGLAKDPPAAKGMSLIFVDDFEGPMSISNDGMDATYMAHKPGGGDFSGWKFTSPMKEDAAPFEQTGTWLRIKARKDARTPKGRSGIIASVNKNFEGVWAQAPCYFEARLTAQSAIGTWPAFWTLAPGLNREQDELDIIEGYGGMGEGNPNHPSYSIVSHAWRQTHEDGTPKKKKHIRPDIMNLGGKSYWSTTFHTYAVYVGLEDTVYYFDNIEVFRHETNDVSRDFPHYFLLNYAIGGISRWPIDLSRYEEGSDMWIDWVRVYATEPVPEDYTPNFSMAPTLKHGGIGLNFSLPGDDATRLKSEQITGYRKSMQFNWNNLEGASGESTEVMDNNGDQIQRLKVQWKTSEEGAATKGEPWGFKKADAALQLGLLKGDGELTIENIPYAKYDVLVYAGAGANAAAGSVTLSAQGAGRVDAEDTRYYRVSWRNGAFSLSTATSADKVKNENTLLFRGNNAKSLRLRWKSGIQGFWTGITGVQILEVK